jgi:tetratricopeptide (TPR) repeat protein
MAGNARRLTVVVATLLAGVASSALARAAAYSDAEIHAIETPDEVKIRELRDQEVTQLRIALGRRSPTNRRADLYFRLAELDLEAYHAEYELEGRAHDARLAAKQPDEHIDHTRSRPFLTAGIKACKEIVGFGISYPKMDQVLYFLAFNYGELDDRAESLRYYTALTKSFPDSSYVAEAYRELGDDAYEQRQYGKAQQLYQLAITKGKGAELPRIHHKLAWAYYRTKQYDRAIESMKQAIDLASKSGEKFLSLREEALRDMAIFMTESGKVEDAIAYFQTVAPDKDFYPRALEKLGKTYERNVEPVKATQVYESLLKTNPGSEPAFRVLVKLVDLDLRRQHFREALVRLEGAKIPAQTTENDTQVALQNLKAMLRRTATEHHEAYRKNGDKADLEIAESYYTAYLEKCLTVEDSRGETPEIRMYLAEVKRDLGKSDEASALYRMVVESKDPRYAKEAGALWTASLAEAIKKQSAENKHREKGDEPSALEKEFIDAADRLEVALAGTSEGREAQLKAAQVLAGYKSTQKQAIKRIRKLIEEAPRSSQSVTAARLWLQLLTDRLAASPADANDTTDELKDAMLELRKNDLLMAADSESGGGKLKAQLAELDTKLKIGNIAKEEKDKDYASAAKGYESFAADAQNRDIAEKAYSNALGDYQRVDDLEGIDRVGAAWLKRYPKSPKAIEDLRGAATTYLIEGHFGHAARLYEKLGREAGDPESLETAARIYEGNADHPHSVQARLAYLDTYSSSPSRPSVLLALARSYDIARQDNEAIRRYRQCMESGGEHAAECGARLADLYQRNDNVAEAKSAFRQTAALSGKSPFIAYARFRLAEAMEKEAKFDQLALPDAQLKKALNQRLEFLEPLSRAYLSAVEAGGPWSIAALERLASWAMQFADDVDRIQPPQTADSEGIAKFNRNVAAISGPLRKKAIGTWNDGYAKAIEASVISPALPEIVDHLADARLATPTRAQGFRGRLRLAGVPADGGSDGRAEAYKRTRERLLGNPKDAAAWVDYGNLMWGSGKPQLARLAYEHSLSLSSKNAAAINNRAVVVLGGDGEEDWFSSAEASQLLKEALTLDEGFLPAKINLACLLNYYRLFTKAKALWDQVLARTDAPDLEDGKGIALQGAGDFAGADKAFKKASDLGSAWSRFVYVYHDAARSSVSGAAGADKCLARLTDLDETTLAGFERSAIERLKRSCTIWKSEKTTQ